MENNNESRIVIWTSKEFHQRVKVFCALHGMSIKEYVTQLIKNDMEKSKARNRVL